MYSVIVNTQATMNVRCHREQAGPAVWRMVSGHRLTEGETTVFSFCEARWDLMTMTHLTPIHSCSQYAVMFQGLFKVTQHNTAHTESSAMRPGPGFPRPLPVSP